MQSTKKEFVAAIVEGKSLAIKHNRPVKLGYSWRIAAWLVDTDLWHEDLIVFPTHVEPRTCVGRKVCAVCKLRSSPC